MIYVDEAHSKTDKILESLERNIKESYNKAYKEVKQDLASVMSKLNLNLEMSPQQRLALMTQKDRLENMLEQYSKVLADTNAMAVKYINNDMLNVYRTNYGYEADKFSMSMVDNTAIKKLLTKEANPFTKISIDNVKDKKNIKSKLRTAMTTSLLKGESIPEMARRIKGVMENSLADSVRIARTETTRIENSARLDVGEQGEKMGFKMLKEWIATNDDRTRPAHADADGQRVPIDEPFIVDGEEMMFPGDVSLGASASNVINCRCTMITIIDENGGKELEGLENQKEDLEANKAYLSKQLEQFGNPVYSGIWKDDVSLKDWKEKSKVNEDTGKSPIEAKKEYYQHNIDAAQNDLSINPDDKWAQKSLEHNEKMLEKVEEFDKQGYEYAKIKDELDATKQDLKDVNERINKLTGKVDDTFSQERKDEALWWKTDTQKSKQEADDVFREQTGEVWRSATEAEKNAIFDYTGEYSKFNQPLRGYDYDYYRKTGDWKYIGTDKVDLNKVGVSSRGYAEGQMKKEIEDMTSFISHYSSEQDMWVNRGVDYKEMDKFFQIDEYALRHASAEDLMEAFRGVTLTENAFFSSSSVKGGGFHGGIKMNVFVPQGSPVAYVEPFSRYSGDYMKRDWNGFDKQSYFGREFETIFQRGAQFRVTKVERSGGTLYVDMDLIGFDTKPL